MAFHQNAVVYNFRSTKSATAMTRLWPNEKPPASGCISWDLLTDTKCTLIN